MRKTILQHAVIMTGLFMVLLLALGAGTEVRAEGRIPGDMDVLFTVEGLDNLGLDTIEGGLGLRYFLTDRWALRSVVSYHYVQTVRDGQEIEGVLWSPSETTNDSWSISLGAQRDLSPVGVVVPHLGGGFFLGGGTSESVYSIPPEPVEGTALKTVTDSKDWGVYLDVGFEFQVARGVRLGSGYTITYTHETHDFIRYRQDMDPDDQPEETRESLGLGTGSLYLAVGF
ncbi:MAG: hypothetical protein ABIK96_02050 [bacterium]